MTGPLSAAPWTAGRCESLVAFDASGNVRRSVPGYTPQIATQDGSIIAASQNSALAGTFDLNGNAVGQTAGLPNQSWLGTVTREGFDGSVASVVSRPVFEDGSTYWPVLGGNPSANGTAIVQCPCLLQSAGGGGDSASVVSVGGLTPLIAGQTDLILAGDPGLNLGPGHNWNVGQLFNYAAQTRASSFIQSGDTVISKRISTVSDFNSALTTNGLISGQVVFFGHGGIDRNGNLALFVGQNPGDIYNLSVLNVGQLSNVNLGPSVTITLNACHSGLRLGGMPAIAQLVANQLRRTVFAYPVDMYFSSDPTPRRFSPRMTTPNAPPVYMVPNGDGIQATRFLAH